MSVMEGFMMVPPDRGTILGRAAWKNRYVAFGMAPQVKTQHDLISHADSSTRRAALKLTSSRPSLVDVTQDGGRGLCISIYKAKGDHDCIAQYSISSFKSCEIRNVQHRKQTPALPTLMLEFKPDSPSEKARRRRSSRTGGLASKDPWANVLLFRTVPEERFNIYDWQVTLKPQLTSESQDASPVEEVQKTSSPASPIFGTFSNPFATRETRTPTGGSRPDFLSRGSNHSVQQYTSTYPHAPRTESKSMAMMSPSPSLRSTRSDLSSQGSSMIPPMGFTSGHPQNNYSIGDLPSPASTVPSGYETQFIEGWTLAQGRSSTLSSHTRGSNSIASAVAAAAPIGATPPGPRETILDRAFQMKYIPGSENVPDADEEKGSSIARFEALMKEVDERQRQKSVTSVQESGTSGWDLDEDSEESSIEDADEDEDPDALDMMDHDFGFQSPAQRALDYISGRRITATTSRPLSPTPASPPIPFLNTQAMYAFHSKPPALSGGLRPRTGTSASQRDMRPTSLVLPSRSMSTAAIPTLNASSSSNWRSGELDPKDIKDLKDVKRSSSTSVKRLSFTEFAKRLSSTSSLLLVQTNASSHSGKDNNSRRASSELAPEDNVAGQRHSASLRGGEKERPCGWRGSVGAFGSESGFL